MRKSAIKTCFFSETFGQQIKHAVRQKRVRAKTSAPMELRAKYGQIFISLKVMGRRKRYAL